MDYLKNLTLKQWLIILSIIVFFLLSYLLYFQRPTEERYDSDLEALMRQGTAPISVDENLTRSEVETLLQQGAVSPSEERPADRLTEDDKDALLRLMSAPSPR